MKLSIGLQVYSVKNELKKDFWGTLKKVAEIGYKNIEFANHKADTDFGVGFNIDAKTLKKGLDDLGLSVIATHVYPLSLNNIENLIEYNTAIGNKAIVNAIQFFKDKEDVIRFSREFNRIGEICRKNGIDLYYHNHFQEFQVFDGQYVLDIIRRNTDKEYVKFELDTYWATRGGVNPSGYIKQLGDRCGLIHQKDLPAIDKPANVFDLIGKDAQIVMETMALTSNADYFTEVGEGVLDIASIIGESEKAGSAKYIIVEQDHTSKSELESIELSFKNLTKLLNER